jgi:DNA-binding transcriptional MocR family regulator
MVSAIRRYLPAEVLFETPQGGLFVWLQLPQGSSSEELLPLAYEAGVDFAPGTPFFPDGDQGRSWLRLNFVSQEPVQIEEGMKRLGKSIRRLIADRK